MFWPIGGHYTACMHACVEMVNCEECRDVILKVCTCTEKAWIHL